jgi:hypothetical protein
VGAGEGKAPPLLPFATFPLSGQEVGRLPLAGGRMTRLVTVSPSSQQEDN